MNSREYLLGKEKIPKAILSLSIPSALSTMANVLYNIIDTIFIGRAVGFIGIAAISIYLPIQMLILGLGLLFASGTGSLISRSLGKKNYEEADKAVGNLVVIITILAVLLSILGMIFAKPLVEIFGAKANVIPLATSYARTMFIGTLVYPFCIASNNIIRAEGNTKFTMIAVFISIFANIILDYIFIMVLHMGVIGAGLATSISKFINFAYLLYYFKYKSLLKIKRKYLHLDFKILKKTLPIGFSTFTNQFTGSIGIIFLNHVLFIYGGTMAIAVYGVVYKLTSFIQLPIGGFSRGVQPLIGFNYGAKNLERVRKSLDIGIILTTIIGFLMTIFMFIFSKPLVSLFTKNLTLINSSSEVLRIALLASPLLGVYFISISFYRAIGRAKEALLISLFRRIIFFIPFLYILPLIFNLKITGIWIVLPLSNFLAALFSIFYLLKDRKITTKELRKD